MRLLLTDCSKQCQPKTDQTKNSSRYFFGGIP
nr:MAG TPA: hypothetical protein [Caudoviricetes sp.]